MTWLAERCAADGGQWDEAGSSLFVPGHCYDPNDPLSKHAPLGPSTEDAYGNPSGTWAHPEHWESNGEPTGWSNPRLFGDNAQFPRWMQPTYRGLAVLGLGLAAVVSGGVYFAHRKGSR